MDPLEQVQDKIVQRIEGLASQCGDPIMKKSLMRLRRKVIEDVWGVRLRHGILPREPEGDDGNLWDTFMP